MPNEVKDVSCHHGKVQNLVIQTAYILMRSLFLDVAYYQIKNEDLIKSEKKANSDHEKAD